MEQIDSRSRPRGDQDSSGGSETVPDYGGIADFEPQEADWNESDTFPNDEALVLHFVSKYPDYDDLEVTITEDILGEEFEGVKKKAAQNLERKARQLGLAPEVLQEIVDAKEKMLKASPGASGAAKAGSRASKVPDGHADQPSGIADARSSVS